MSIEENIEHMWLDLTALRSGRSLGVYVTPCGRVCFEKAAERVLHAELVGTYNNAVLLRDLREDVFHIYERVKRFANQRMSNDVRAA